MRTSLKTKLSVIKEIAIKYLKDNIYYCISFSFEMLAIKQRSKRNYIFYVPILTSSILNVFDQSVKNSKYLLFCIVTS